MIFKLAIIGICVASASAYVVNPGIKIPPTLGEVWPKPQFQDFKSDEIFTIDTNQFYFDVVGETCHILENAIIKYRTIITEIMKSPLKIVTRKLDLSNELPPTTINSIAVNLSTPCEMYPYVQMDESYLISIEERSIHSNSIWGILRGLETFSQLITPYDDRLLRISNTFIVDYPRYRHRGLLVDTARHFLHLKTLHQILDGMAYNKMNVMHWHIVDDQSFPYESMKYPNMSKMGAFSTDMIYSQEDVANVIEYARLLGIRVISEFDVPGHTRSWGNAHPEILTSCGDPYKGMLGPMNPINNETYTFLQNFLDEVLNVFQDEFMHLGGDEVGFECWESNEDIVNYIASKNITYTQLQKMFMENATRMVTAQKKNPIVWQEAMVENVNMPQNTVVQVWLGDWQGLMNNFTQKGLQVILSECWYLDHLVNGGDWTSFYNCEPESFNGTDTQNQLVLGGEACMWAEVVNDRNVVQRIFPRVSAVAERLWSDKTITNTTEAANRLEEHTCRMINRGLPAQPPNGAGIC